MEVDPAAQAFDRPRRSTLDDRAHVGGQERELPRGSFEQASADFQPELLLGHRGGETAQLGVGRVFPGGEEAAEPLGGQGDLPVQAIDALGRLQPESRRVGPVCQGVRCSEPLARLYCSKVQAALSCFPWSSLSFLCSILISP